MVHHASPMPACAQIREGTELAVGRLAALRVRAQHVGDRKAVRARTVPRRARLAGLSHTYAGSRLSVGGCSNACGAAGQRVQS